MTERDPIFARLARLPAPEPSRELSSRLRAAAHARLRPRRLHLAWTVLVAGSAIGYFTLSVRFVGRLYAPSEPSLPSDRRAETPW
jgi:hypothetical protein